jgi:hypothetical protein
MTLTSFPNARRLKRVAGRGRACRFFVLDGIGHKVYWNRNYRDELFAAQDYLYHLGFAPRVGNTFEVRHQRCMCFGYTTEVAELLVDARDGMSAHSRFANHPDSNRLGNEIELLCDQMTKAGISFYDKHPGNFGLVRGKMVVLDYEEFCYENWASIAA